MVADVRPIVARDALGAVSNVTVTVGWTLLDRRHSGPGVVRADLGAVDATDAPVVHPHGIPTEVTPVRRTPDWGVTSDHTDGGSTGRGTRRIRSEALNGGA